jgi:transcriptional regulator with PAS, ATPase and Fis domain
MNVNEWADTLHAAITVCDKDGIVLYMNEASQQVFKQDGGLALIGKSLFDCHSPASVDQIKSMMASDSTNTYTVQKKGIKKFVLQAPFDKDGICGGMVEISFEIPQEIPHRNRG